MLSVRAGTSSHAPVGRKDDNACYSSIWTSFYVHSNFIILGFQISTTINSFSGRCLNYYEEVLSVRVQFCPS
jgi:hypothetical protein